MRGETRPSRPGEPTQSKPHELDEHFISIRENDMGDRGSKDKGKKEKQKKAQTTAKEKRKLKNEKKNK